jgi:hypothetical protein
MQVETPSRRRTLRPFGYTRVSGRRPGQRAPQKKDRAATQTRVTARSGEENETNTNIGVDTARGVAFNVIDYVCVTRSRGVRIRRASIKVIVNYNDFTDFLAGSHRRFRFGAGAFE